MTDSINAAVGG
jgi:hypothetical protein